MVRSGFAWLSAGLVAALFIAGACTGDDPVLPPSSVNNTPDGNGGVDAPVGSEASVDAGPEGGEPAAVGTLLSVESFRVGNAAQSGLARVAFGADGSRVVGFTFTAPTTILGTTVTGQGGLDIGVAKIDPSGKLAWAKAFGGAGDDRLFGLAVDDAGEVYISGDFESPSVTFEVARARSGSVHAPFLAKLAHDSGKALKSVTFDVASNAGGRCTSVAARAGVIAVGCSLDGPAGTIALDTGGAANVAEPPTNAGTAFFFLAELDPTSLGARWFNALGAFGADRVEAVALAPSGDLVFAALTGNSLDGDRLHDAKGSVNVLAYRAGTAAIGRLSKVNGTSVWTRTFGSTVFGNGMESLSVAVDSQSNVFFGGSLFGTLSIDGADYTPKGPGASTAPLLLKLRASDGAPETVRLFNGTATDTVSGLAIDPWDNLLLDGVYRSSDLAVGGVAFPAPTAPGVATLFLLKVRELGSPMGGRWVHVSNTNSSLAVTQGLGVAPDGTSAHVALFNGYVSFGEAAPRQSDDGGTATNLAIVTRGP